MRHAFCVFGLLAACGGGGNTTPDAFHDGPTTHHDAAPDTAADASGDGPIISGTKHHYVADREFLPQNNTEARDYALDLNGDGTVDNQFGMVIATFASQGASGPTTQAATDTQIDHGQTIILVELETSDFQSATNAGVTTYQGSNPQPPACASSSDTTCRHHLTGSASFTVAAGTPHDPLLVGNFVAGTLTTPVGTGTLALPIVNSVPPTFVDLIGARVQVTGASATGLTAILAGGVPTTELDTKVYPALQATEMAAVTHDCTALTNPPACGCASGSNGKNALALFDTNADCAISVDEIKNNNLIQSLFAPDLTINGQMALSFGVKITAVGATFTP